MADSPTLVREPIPVWKSWYRKLITIRAVSDGTLRGTIDQPEFVRRIGEIQRAASATPDMGRKTAAFWRMENLTSYFLKQALLGTTLDDPRLPVEARPIAHCGMGVAAVEVANFDPARIKAIVDSFSNPDYRLFGYEGSGAMLALYERDLFGVATRSFALMGVLPLPSLQRPRLATFLGAFDAEIQRLIAHGYGRMLYFKNHSLGAAIRSARSLQLLDFSACIQGVAFAYAMVNNAQLPLVLRSADGLDETVRATFTHGLIYALEFWEWMAPGFLSLMKAGTERERTLLNAARTEIERCRSAGSLRAFA